MGVWEQVSPSHLDLSRCSWIHCVVWNVFVKTRSRRSESFVNVVAKVLRGCSRERFSVPLHWPVQGRRQGHARQGSRTGRASAIPSRVAQALVRRDSTGPAVPREESTVARAIWRRCTVSRPLPRLRSSEIVTSVAVIRTLSWDGSRLAPCSCRRRAGLVDWLEARASPDDRAGVGFRTFDPSCGQCLQ